MSYSDVTLVVLDPIAEQIFTCDGNGRVLSILRQNIKSGPDGIVLSKEGTHFFGTTMGAVERKEFTAYGYDGAIWRMSLDGSEVEEIVPAGQTRTPKQITLDRVNDKLYWGDREGLRVMRCNFDGSELETIYESGDLPGDETDQTKWCVGVAVDPERRRVYVGLKGNPDAGEGQILSMGYDIPAGESARTRSDIRVLLDQRPEPIDFEITGGYFYWTDRGDLAGGNSVSRVRVAADGGFEGDVEIIAQGIKEAIGLVVCEDKGVVYSSSLTGELYRARLDGSDVQETGKFGGLTGIARLN